MYTLLPFTRFLIMIMSGIFLIIVGIALYKNSLSEEYTFYSFIVIIIGFILIAVGFLNILVMIL